MAQSKKQMVRTIAGNPVVRWFSFGLATVFDLLGRSWTHLRFRALVPHAGLSLCHWTTEIKYPENITIGDRSRIGPHCVLGAMSPITIGNDVTVSRGVVIETAGLDIRAAIPYPHRAKPIVIHDGVWIADNAMILGGVTIGERAVIGAGALVVKDVPAGAIIVHAPAAPLPEKENRSTPSI